MLGLLHRTIFYELVKVFVFSLVGITGIIVLAAIVVEASQHGLSPGQILEAIPLIVPSMLPFIVPPTTLFTTCVVYGRLAADNEIIAIKAAGISVLHVVWPGLFLGLVMSCATFGLFINLIPYTQHLLRTAIANDVEEFLYGMLKRDGEILRRPEIKLDYEMWVGEVQGRILKNAVFKRRDKKGNLDVIAKAREAELRVNRASGEVLVHLRNGNFVDPDTGRNRLSFDHQTVSVPIPEFDKRAPSSREMTWNELLAARIELNEEMAKRRAEIAMTVIQEGLANAPNLPLHRQNLESILHGLDLRLKSYDVELYMRPALAFGCFFFVLVGCPVGIWLSRSDYLSSFITCFLPIVFIYYPLQLCATNLAKDGKIHPGIGLWIADGVVGILAIGLFRKLFKN